MLIVLNLRVAKNSRISMVWVHHPHQEQTLGLRYTPASVLFTCNSSKVCLTMGFMPTLCCLALEGAC